MKIFAAIALAIFASSASAETYEERYERLKKMKTCIETMKAANARFQYMKDSWFDSESSLDVSKNFEFLRTKHARYFAEVRKFTDEPAPAPGDMEEIAKAIGRLDRAHLGILSDLEEVRKADELFVLSMPPIDDGLSQVGGEFLAAKTVCDPALHPTLEGAAASIADLREQILTMILYVNQAAQKRSQLFGAVLQAKKANLLKAYSDATHVPLAGLQTKIDAMLAADSLYGRIQAWWTIAMIKDGVGRGAVTRDLQFAEGLRNLRSDQELGERLQVELTSMSNLSPSVRQEIQGDLTLYLKQIRDQIVALEQGGYEAVFAKQKLLSAKRRQLLSAYGSKCKQALEAFDSAASLVTNEQAFRAMENVYKWQVVTCRAP